MAANLTRKADGSAMLAYAVSGGVPWHKEGTPIVLTRDTEYFYEQSGLNELNMEKRELAIVVRDKNGKIVRYDVAPMESFRAIQRKENGEVFFVGSDDYGILTPHDFIWTLDPVVREFGGEWESALSTFGGREMAASIKLPMELTVGNDKLMPYLFAHTRNDGQGKAEIFDTIVRPICANTVAAAQATKHRAKFSLSIVHRENNIKAKLAEADAILRASMVAFKDFEEVANKLLKAKATPALANEMVEFLLPMPEIKPKTEPRFVGANGIDFTVAKEVASDKEPVQVRRRNEAVEFLNGAINEEFSVTGKNCWALYNAATGFGNHGVRMSNSKNPVFDKRLRSVMDDKGAGNIMGTRAMAFLADKAGITLK